MKSKLQCIIDLGLARMSNAVEHVIWMHSTTFELTGDPDCRGYYTLLAFKPHYPERCADCDCCPLEAT